MGNVERNVKGENSWTRRKFLREATAGLMLLSSGVAALAEKPESNLPSPLEAQRPIAAINHGETTSSKAEDYQYQETDPFSEEGLNETCFAGWAHMTEEQKSAIKKRMITHASGAAIFFSTRTLIPNRYDPGAVEGFLSRVNLSSLSETSRVVIDRSMRNHYDVIVFNVDPRSSPPKLSPPFVERMITSEQKQIVRNYNRYIINSPAMTVTLWRDGQPIQLTNAHKDCQKFTAVHLDEFSFHPAFDPARNQIVWTDGLRARGYFDPNSLITQSRETEDGELISTQYLPPRPFDLEDVILYGDRKSRMRKNLEAFLIRQPELFTDPSGVEHYVKTGDKRRLKDILFYPNDDPVFFVLVGSNSESEPNDLIMAKIPEILDSLPKSFKPTPLSSKLNPLTITIRETVNFLQNCAPETFDLLNKMGLRTVLGGHMNPVEYAASFKVGLGIVLINYENSLFNNLSNHYYNNDRRTAHMTANLLVETVGLDCFDYFNHLTVTDADIAFLQGIYKSNFLKGFAQKHQKDLPNDVYNALIEESLATLMGYWRSHGS